MAVYYNYIYVHISIASNKFFGGNYMYMQEKPFLSDIFPNANELAYISSALGDILLGSILNITFSKYAYNNLTPNDN